MTTLFLMLLLLIMSVSGIHAKETEIHLNDGWKAKRANELTVDRIIISSPVPELTGWMGHMGKLLNRR